MSRARRILVVQHSLAAEGGPVLVLSLIRGWRKLGLDAEVLTLYAMPADLAEVYRSAGVTVRCADLPAGRRRYPAISAAVFKAARARSADAVLSMTYGWHTFMALGARAAGVRSFAAHVGNYPPHWDEENFRAFRFLVFAGQPVTRALICCSEYVASGVREHFRLGRDNTRVVYNGVPTEQIFARASVARSARAPASPFCVGMVGRLDATKDHPTLIRAFAKLSRERPDARLLLVGAGSGRPGLEALVSELGLTNVEFTGARTDVPEQLARMDVFAFAAKPGEGLGMAPIEAMAAGVRVIASDVPALREVLAGGACGELYPPGDVESLATRLLAAAGGAATSQVDAARTRASAVFSEDAMSKGYADILFEAR